MTSSQLLDVAELDVALPAALVAHPLGHLPRGFEVRTRVEPRCAAALARLAVDHHARTAESLELLQAGHHRVPEEVEGGLDVLGRTRRPSDPAPRTLASVVLAVHDGDLPFPDLDLGGHDLGAARPQRCDLSLGRAHVVLRHPRRRGDAVSGLAVDQHRKSDAAVHARHGRHDFLAHKTDALVDAGGIALDRRGACIHHGTPPPPRRRPGGATDPSQSPLVPERGQGSGTRTSGGARPSLRQQVTGPRPRPCCRRPSGGRPGPLQSVGAITRAGDPRVVP